LALSRDEQIKEIFHGVNESYELFEVFTAVHISNHPMMNMEAARPINIYSLDLIEKLYGLVDLHQSSNTTQNWTDEFGAISGVKFTSHGCVFLKMPRVSVRSKGNLRVEAKLLEAPAIPGSRGNVVRLDDAVIKRGENVIQPVEFNFHAKGTVRKIMKHGILVLEPYEEPMWGSHLSSHTSHWNSTAT
jgi:hypothetical protein